MIEKIKCPLCDWSARNEVEPSNREFIKSYLAKALMTHLHIKHARHGKLHDKATNISFTTIMGKESGEGIVELAVNEEIVQLTLDKAREIHKMLGEAIEASVSDWLIYRFFTEKIKFDADKAAMVLMDFRELRQGSKDKVPPS